MPKNQFINPAEVRKAGFIEFIPIPVNQYNKTVSEEKENFSKEDFFSSHSSINNKIISYNLKYI